ncbi:DHHW family protein [uncultured Bacteroides sp.]|uniref:DHHW family protein n=1 Tax=uncultured Bacteroides sp. TaxID=162156 RepID=UPI00261C1635|nr:DHHW family protein [uncultured Bacteroides sp.]
MKLKYMILSGLAVILMAQSVVTVEAQQVRRGRKGIIVRIDSTNVRAMQPFKGVSTGGSWYADAINQYRDTLSDDIRIYNMVIPTSVAYYCPDEASDWSRPEEPVINHIYSLLKDGVTPVNVYPVLQQHVDEDIYARTDHHWLPLGAYYAAQEFARVAGVPFEDISTYDKQVVRDFVGTMYRFSGDVAVKNSPEDFVYYTPRDTNYVTTYVGHKLGKRRNVIGLTDPFEGPFFIRYEDGSKAAYCTFMGGDVRTTHVKTMADNGRKLMIIKDSFGNALPGYLFYSFEDIFVVDFRYFTKNIVDYIHENGITDILFANNILHAYMLSTARAYVQLLHK